MTMFSRNGGTTLPRLPILSPDHNLSRFTRWWRRRRMPFGSACVFSDGPEQCCTGILMWRSYPAQEVGGMGAAPLHGPNFLARPFGRQFVAEPKTPCIERVLRQRPGTLGIQSDSIQIQDVQR